MTSRLTDFEERIVAGPPCSTCNDTGTVGGGLDTPPDGCPDCMGYGPFAAEIRRLRRLAAERFVSIARPGPRLGNSTRVIKVVANGLEWPPGAETPPEAFDLSDLPKGFAILLHTESSTEAAKWCAFLKKSST